GAAGRPDHGGDGFALPCAGALSRQALRAGLCRRNGQGAGGCARGFIRGDRATDDGQFLQSVFEGAAGAQGRGMSLTFTILGCGSSMGVPRVALGWGHCDPTNPKNRRQRCSLLVERTAGNGRTRVLVDCSPDLRAQLLAAEVDWLDGVLFTHEHADHTHGIDDLRSLFIHKRKRINVYLDALTSEILHARFSYCFISAPGSDYPPILSEKEL